MLSEFLLLLRSWLVISLPVDGSDWGGVQKGESGRILRGSGGEFWCDARVN